MATNGSVLGYINAPPLNTTLDDPSNASLSPLEYVESALLALNPFSWLIPDTLIDSVVSDISDIEDVNETGSDVASGGLSWETWAIGIAAIIVLVLIVLLIHEVDLL